MYTLSEEQIDFILHDIKQRGIELEDLQLNLLDHICCIIEKECDADMDFEAFYKNVITRFFKKELKEIETETILILTYKNYYAMKKTMLVSGTSAAILLIIGSFFKVMHWPGASILLVSGTVFLSLIFLPLLFLTKSQESSNNSEKAVLGIGAFVGMLYCLSTLFKVMHWPGASYLWVSTIVVSAFIFIPVYFFTGIKKEERKMNTIVTTIILIGATSILFMLINTRPAKKELQLKMYNYLQSEALLQGMQKEQYSGIKTTNETSTLLSAINENCEQIKALILQNALGQKIINNDFEAQNIVMEDGRLGNGFYDNEEGVKMFLKLEELLTKYNEKAAIKIPLQNTILDTNFGTIANYNRYSVLSNIQQLQMKVALTKS
jgi:hypothetical protein